MFINPAQRMRERSSKTGFHLSLTIFTQGTFVFYYGRIWKPIPLVRLGHFAVAAWSTLPSLAVLAIDSSVGLPGAAKELPVPFHRKCASTRMFRVNVFPRGDLHTTAAR